MTGALSPTATGQVFGQEGGGFLALLVINHPTLTDPIRVVNNTVDVTSNGNLYTAFPFDIQLPDDKDATPPAAKLTLDNVSRELSQIIRSITTPPTIDISIIRMDDLDAVEQTLPQFRLRNVEWDSLTISGDLTIDDIAKEPFPARSYTPSEYPALFLVGS